MSRKILVTPRSTTRDGHPSLERLRRAGYEVIFCRRGVQPTEDELCELLPGCIGYLAGAEPIPARVMEAAAELRVISRNGTGVDGIDLKAAESRGIEVLRAEGANAAGVAELTMAFILVLARRILEADAAFKAGHWSRPSTGIELEGRTLGLVGCGRIGRRVARLALLSGMNVAAFDSAPDARFHPGDRFAYAALEDVLRQCDFLSLHCPPAEHAAAILDADALAQTRRGVFLINTARRSLIDPDALLAALDLGHIAGAALDVFDSEAGTDWRLARHPRVLATPHLGGYTEESIDRAMQMAVENLLEALAKGPRA